VRGDTEPGCVVVEGVYYGQNVRSMVILAHARGVAVLTAAQRDLPVFEYPPAEIKKAVVGTGAATKEQVSYMVAKHLRLATPPEPSDASDGCAAALCHLMGGRSRPAEVTAAGSTPAGGS
jgi:crossover junction endodeoxyribonuclease RuvC